MEGLIAATRAMEQRTKSLEGELQASSEQVTELRGKLDDVRKESLTDPLTSIANRKAFDDAVEAGRWPAWPRARKSSLLMCDIDHFKKFNDSWGHQTGDQVLRLVANCLSRKRQGPRHRGALWRRGIRRAAARHRAGRRHPCRRPDPRHGARPRSW